MKDASLLLPFEAPTPPPRSQTENQPFPHVLQIADVKAYLRKNDRTIDASPDTFPSTQDARRWEEMLMTDLWQAKRATDATKINELRALLYALCWPSHEPPDRGHLLQLVDQVERLVREDATRLGGHGSSLDDAKEYLEEYLPSVKAIREALRSNACGTQAESAIQGIETFLESTQEMLLEPGGRQKKGRALQAVQQRLDILRPLRDQIYYQYVYGPWCETAPHITKH